MSREENMSTLDARKMEQEIREKCARQGIKLGAGGVTVTVEGGGVGYSGQSGFKPEKGNITEI